MPGKMWFTERLRTCNGRGWPLVLSEVKGIAVMLEDCGDVEQTLIKTGAVVSFSTSRGRKPRIVGQPAYFVPVTIGNWKFGDHPD